VLIAVFATLLVSFDELGLETSFSAVLAALSNIGPGLGGVGPASSYDCFSRFSKVVLTLCMLIGRLEIFPILILAVPDTWRKH
jgi:trk system potassium uptake protein TrkH